MFVAVIVPSELLVPITRTSLPATRSDVLPSWVTETVVEPDRRTIFVLPLESLTVMLLSSRLMIVPLVIPPPGRAPI